MLLLVLLRLVVARVCGDGYLAPAMTGGGRGRCRRRRCRRTDEGHAAIEFPPLIRTPSRHALHVLLQIDLVEQGRFGVVPFDVHLRSGGGGIMHAVALEEGVHLGVAAFQQGQDLLVRPRVHGNGAHEGGLHAVGTVPTAAAEAEERAVGDAGPVWMRCAAVAALVVAGDGQQETAARSGKARCAFLLLLRPR